jgi:hypothetical protein
VYSVKQAAQQVGITEGLLVLWISTGRFRPSVVASLKSTDFARDSVAARALASWTGEGEEALGWNRFTFTDADITRLRNMVGRTAVAQTKVESAHEKGTNYTVAQVAKMWNVNAVTVRRKFANEPDVVKLKNPAKRGKRAYTTLLIPEDVELRVRKELAR